MRTSPPPVTRLPRWLTLPLAASLAVLAWPAAGAAASAATPHSAPARPAASAQDCTSAPSGSGFYQPPDPLPSGQHGDIIWCRPVSSPVAGATAWQILYLSTTVTGAPTAVSGTVLVPTSAFPGTRPVVAYASGTQGWGDQCAASKEMSNGVFDEQFAVSNLLSKGWAVTVTDYPGLGTPGDEDYSVGIAEGRAVLDSVRAAALLPGSGLSTSAPVGIEGYSQGGSAADWAAQLQPSYAPSLRLTGVAAGGTPANLQAVSDNIDGTAFFAFLGGSAIGFNAAYPSLDLNSELTPDGQAALAQLDTMCQAQALITFAGKRIEDYTIGGINPITQPNWEAVLDANNLGGIKPQVPLFQYHGLLDEVIPYSVEAALHRQYCALGVTTKLTGFVGDHVLTQVLAQTAVVNWLGARIAGSPAPDDC
jgi:hypothetical protein